MWEMAGYGKYIILLSILGGVLYRLGGKGKPFDTKFRDIGTALCVVAIILVKGMEQNLWNIFALTFSFIAMFGALTTYRYFLPKPENYKFLHYALHGFIVSFAMIFFAWSSGLWEGFWLRCIINTILIGYWSEYISWDDLEEWGRGFIFCITVWLL